MELEQEQPTELTQEAFDTLLQSVWERFVKFDYSYKEVMQQDLQTLFVKAKQDMDADSYVKLLFICAKRYEYEDKKRACAYCVMRIAEILKLAKRKKKAPRFLRMNPIAPCAKRDAFIQEKTDFIKPHIKEMDQKLQLMTLGVFVILVLLLVLFLSTPWIYAIIEAILLGGFAYLINRIRLPKMFWKKQLDALANDVEQEVLELDMPIRFG